MSIFLCGHGNFMIGRSFVEAVSGLKTTCNSLDPPDYPLSHRVYVYVAFWRQRKLKSAIEAKKVGCGKDKVCCKQ